MLGTQKFEKVILLDEWNLALNFYNLAYICSC